MNKTKNINQMAIFAFFLCLCMVTATLCVSFSCKRRDVYSEQELELTELEDLIQAGGHEGTIKAGPDEGTIIKPYNSQEEECYKILMTDDLRPFVAEYKGVHVNNDGKYLVLENLQSSFTSVLTMDCKIGVRTYHETENRFIRADLYKLFLKMMGKYHDRVEKIMGMDEKTFLKDAEGKKGIIAKSLMRLYDKTSTTSEFGFRIVGYTKFGAKGELGFPLPRSRSDLKAKFEDFVAGFLHAIPEYLQRLIELRDALLKSHFFKIYEIIGSSLYFLHDKDKASIWMIDFAQTITLPKGMTIKHDVPWKMGNHEDGYLIGINTLINIFEELRREVRH